MNLLRRTGMLAIVVFGLTLGSFASAATYAYIGVVTLCTGTCASFAALDLGSQIFGTYEINTTAGGSFGDADMLGGMFELLNPAAPLEPFTGSNPTTANPLTFDGGSGVTASNGTAGTTDALNQLNGGQILLEFLEPPYSSNSAFVIFDLATGDGQICLFYATAGCIPGATEAVRWEGSFQLVPIPAAVWLFGSALLGIIGLGRRSEGTVTLTKA